MLTFMSLLTHLWFIRVQGSMQLLGRLTFPISMLAFPFYLLNRSPGKEGSHYDPKADLFKENEGGMVSTPS